MNMKLKIKITKEVLEATKYCSADGPNKVSENCAIAYAIRSVFPKTKVGYTTVDFAVLNDWHDVIDLPESAKAFIPRFDALKNWPEERPKMKPFEFEIDVPDSIIDSIGISEAKRIIAGSKTLELVQP